eukprot:c17529_g1_i2 orf=869-1198(+)
MRGSLASRAKKLDRKSPQYTMNAAEAIHSTFSRRCRRTSERGGGKRRGAVNGGLQARKGRRDVVLRFHFYTNSKTGMRRATLTLSELQRQHSYITQSDFLPPHPAAAQN